jgi:hypothetical protein
MQDPPLSPSVTLTPEEEYVKAILEDKGAQVVLITRTSDRTPDFDVQFSGTRYIVEVKTREEDKARVQTRHETLARGEVHGESQELKRKNTISRIIDDGVEQLVTVTDPNVHRIIWVHCGAPNGEAHKHQFFNAFYGATRLYDIDDTSYKVDGLYSRDSDLFRYRALLDGAVITMEIGDECQLFCLCNNHSPNYQAFRVSPLAQAFPVGLYDPLQQEAAGEALVIRGTFDRRRADAVSAHLYQITGRRIYNIDFNMTSATIAVPRGVLGT